MPDLISEENGRECDEIVHRIKLFSAKIEEKRLITELEDMLCRYLLKDPLR